MQNPPANQVADFVVLFLMCSLLTIGLVSMAYGRIVAWLEARAGVNDNGDYDDEGARVLSSATAGARSLAPSLPLDFETETRGVSPQEIQVNRPETPDFGFIDPARLEMLARLVSAGALGKTAAIQIGLQLPSGAKYQAGKAALDAELERINGRDREAEREKRLEEIAQKVAQRA